MTDNRAIEDGVGVNGKLLAAFTSVGCDLGSGMLAQMGVKQRMALRQPLVTSSGHQQSDGRMLITLIAHQDKPITAARKDYSFQPAVTVDMHDERLGETFRASAITDARAHEHGYATADAMRKSLQLGKNEDPILFSYAIRVANPVEMVTEDADKAGTYLNARRDAAYKIWSELPNERTVRWAHDYLETLPEEKKFRAIALITPREKLNGLAAYAPEGILDLASNGQRPLPQEVAIVRSLPAEALPPKKPVVSEPKTPRYTTGGKLTEGDGWQLYNPQNRPQSKPTKTDEPTPQPQAPESTRPKPLVRAPGIRTTQMQRRAASALVTKKEALEGFDDVSPTLQDSGRIARAATKFAADDEARIRRAKPRTKKPAPLDEAPDSLNSDRGRG